MGLTTGGNERGCQDGDHSYLPLVLVMFVRPLPSGFITKRSAAPLPGPPKMIFVPSGDHAESSPVEVTEGKRCREECTGPRRRTSGRAQRSRCQHLLVRLELGGSGERVFARSGTGPKQFDVALFVCRLPWTNGETPREQRRRRARP